MMTKHPQFPLYASICVAVVAVLFALSEYNDHVKRVAFEASAPTPVQIGSPEAAYWGNTTARQDAGFKTTSQIQPQSLADCLMQQRNLTYLNVKWPGFHPLCVVRASPNELAVHALIRETGKITTVAGSTVREVLNTLQPLLDSDYGDDDVTISTSDYAFPPHEWHLYTMQGERIVSGAQVQMGDLAGIYTGGQFIWPGWHLGHVTKVDVPLVDDNTGEETFRTVAMTTVSLRPLAFEIHGLLTDAECDFVRDYASSRLVRSKLAFMDASNKDDTATRTSTQVFMPRGGSPTILHLEHRAHNLTRLPYELGENLQVLKYEPGQKYGAHRDYFSPNDYHKQPAMLQSVEFGARNRLATVFWYMSDVDAGGETYFPRALNEAGAEYNPWNGDHEDCYRGIAVKPTKGNAVLFYGMTPDGRLDERSLHGGCPPRGDGPNNVKWGVNQWIWNQPRKHAGRTFPWRAAKAASPGCEDSNEFCKAWASSGECDTNPGFMHSACPAACKRCK